MEILSTEIENNIEEKNLLLDDYEASTLLVNGNQISCDQLKQEILLVPERKFKNKLESIILIISILLIGSGTLIMLFAMKNSQNNTTKSYYFLDVLGK